MKELTIKIVLLLLIIDCFQPVFGQLTTSNKSKNKAWIMENTASSNLIRVDIQELKDSTISVLLVDRAMSPTLKHYNINEVKKIKFKSKKRQLIGTFIGATVGAIVGASFGSVIKELADDPGLHSPNVVFNSGLIVGAIGGLAGYGLGSIKVTIPINGQKSNYQRKRKKIEKYALLKN